MSNQESHCCFVTDLSHIHVDAAFAVLKNAFFCPSTAWCHVWMMSRPMQQFSKDWFSLPAQIQHLPLTELRWQLSFCTLCQMRHCVIFQLVMVIVIIGHNCSLHSVLTFDAIFLSSNHLHSGRIRFLLKMTLKEAYTLSEPYLKLVLQTVSPVITLASVSLNLKSSFGLITITFHKFQWTSPSVFFPSCRLQKLFVSYMEENSMKCLWMRE